MNDLPEINFVDVDPEKIRNDVITTYEAISGRTLFPADPVRLFLLSMAQIIIQQRVLINDTAKQNLLRYARNNVLDHMGYFVDTSRLDPTPSITTVRFTLSAPRPDAVLIPEGIRVTPGNEIYFATRSVSEITPGNLSVDITCECLDPGEIGNGFIPGQINVLVDPLPWIESVENITESSGGTNREDDERYKERIRTSPERFSVAGPEGAYDYWARTANKDIADVYVWSPAPSEVEIRVLMQGGELPTQDMLDEVLAVCNDRRVRPLTDLVTALAPDVVDYDIDLTYWIDTQNATMATEIQQSVQRAVNEYILWQKTKIGRDINPSELVRLAMNAGARRVNVSSPVFTVVDPTEVAVEETVTVNYGGLEDD